MSKKRAPLPMKKSRKLFTRSAKKVNKKNGIAPMRGGIRL